MSRRVIIVGAGMGGLTAAVRLGQRGYRVTVVEARPRPGGLASGFEKDGFRFDAGPYILLDRPGLDWAFGSLGLQLAEQVPLRRVEDVYEVRAGDGPPVRCYAAIEHTARGLDEVWPGSGRRYTNYVAATEKIYQTLRPLLHRPPPGLVQLLRCGAWRHAPFLLRSLRSVLSRTGLPQPVLEALAIWTHIAGQPTQEAPSPLAFVPVLIHGVGPFYPVGGMETIPRALAGAAVAAGVEFRYATPVRGIRCAHGRVCGVETDDTLLPADAVVSNAGGVGTYLRLVGAIPPVLRQRLEKLPLQSPGVCAYLAVRGRMRPPYLRFRLGGGEPSCRLLVLPGVVVPEREHEGWWPARLIGTMDHATAERQGPSGQRAYLERLLAEGWWREQVEEVRVLETRLPGDWGRQFHLYRDSMNPVMTAAFMRAGRLAHRSPHVHGLYLAGSSTHPGQWVSFCAISGILAADRVGEDLG